VLQRKRRREGEGITKGGETLKTKIGVLEGQKGCVIMRLGATTLERTQSRRAKKKRETCVRQGEGFKRSIVGKKGGKKFQSSSGAERQWTVPYAC